MFVAGTVITILMVDDDEEDREMTREAVAQGLVISDFSTANSGDECLDYLYQRGRFSDPKAAPRPSLILLDLNMPGKDGRAVLREIKADPELRHIPVVVLTTSEVEADILQSYDLGANSYIVKPVTFRKLVEVMIELGKYWFAVVELPHEPVRATQSH